MIDEYMIEALERALSAGLRVQLKMMKDGSIKAQVISAKELKVINKAHAPTRVERY